MDKELWQEVKRIFHEVEAYPIPERQAVLRERCAGNLDLQQQVERLLNPDADALAKLAEPFFDMKVAVENPLLPGSHLDAYLIQKKIGEGGSGVVYLASHEQAGLKKNVAIKILRYRFHEAYVMERFQKEQQILAYLNHPWITRHLGAGTTPQDQPYLVMEYVEGLPIDRYCQQHRLPLRQRVQLFRKVCQAVHSAHQHLIIHRDLKPSNILVTQAGEPKLLDFGVAKILADDDSGPAQTQQQLRAFTPAYASPEQVLGLPTSTASDVYSLGTLLYQLLTQQRPYDLENTSKHEWDRVVSKVVPEKPSLRVKRQVAAAHSSANESNQASAWPKTEPPSRTAKLLAGNLDAIVMRALRKEPSDRYSSVKQLDEDLGRFLDGYPVKAVAGSRTYHTRMFIKRNRLLLTGLSLGFLLLFGFMGQLLYQRNQIAMQKKQADTERNRAVAIAQFMQDIFRLASPYQAEGKNLTARDLLDQGTRQIQTQFQTEPESRAALLRTMAQSYLSLGEPQQAEALIDEAFAILKPIVGEDHPEITKIMLEIGRIALQKDDLKEAETRLKTSLAKAQKTFPRGDSVIIQFLILLSDCYRLQEKFDPAEQLLKDAIVESQHSPNHLRETHQAMLRNNLGRIYSDKGEYRLAIDNYEQTLQLKKQTLGLDHPHIPNTINNLALVHRRMGNYDAAIQLYEESLALTEEIFGKYHENTRVSLNNLGSALYYNKQLAEAEGVLLKVIEVYDRLGTPENKRFQTFATLGKIYQTQGEFSEAERFMKQALEITAKSKSRITLPYLACLTNLAGLYRDQKKFGPSEELFLTAIDTVQNSFGEHHPYTAKVLYSQALLFERQGQAEKAMKNLATVLNIRETKLGLEHPEYFAAFRKALELAGNDQTWKQKLQLDPRKSALLDCFQGSDNPRLKQQFDALMETKAQELL